MRIRTVTLVGAGAASAAAFAAAAAPVANTAVTLTGAAASISPPREVTLTSSGDVSGVQFTVRGLDRRGNPFTEIVQGPGAATTIQLRGVYSSIVSITPNASDADTVSFGSPQRVVSPWFLTDTTRAAEAIPIGKIQALQPDPPAVFAAGIVELSEQNAARLYGEQAQAETTTLALATIGSTVAPQGAWFRIVNTQAAGTLKVAIARPSH